MCYKEGMALVPAPEGGPHDETTLVFGAAEIEPIVVSVAVERLLDRRVNRIFVPIFELWRLAELPAFAQGTTKTVALSFPSPDLDQRPDLVGEALRKAEDLRWISAHPWAAGDVAPGAGVTVLRGESSGLWPAVARALELPQDGWNLDEDLRGILEQLPEVLPEPEDAAPSLAWRYALEAARQEPFTLRSASQPLVVGDTPEEELVRAGHGLLLERREIAAESRFPTFSTPGGTGVIVMAPRSAVGFYRDLAADARRHRGCVVSVLGFDSHEPIFVDFERRPSDLDAKLELLRAALPSYAIRELGGGAFAVKGPATGGLELLTKLLEILGRELD